jgi:class 3 adenylate cyclase
MSNPTPLITKKIVFEYHLLGLVIILSYLMIGLRTQIFWEIFPVIGTAGLCLVAASAVFRFKRPVWIHSLSFVKNQTQQLIFDLSPYLFTGLVVTLIELQLLNHPPIFVGKAVVAIVSIGFYIALGIALEVECEHIKSYQGNEPKNITQILPAGVKLRYFLLTLLTVGLLIFSLTWLAHVLQPDKRDFIGLLFTSAVVICLSCYLLYLYHRNFIYVVGMQVNILSRVENGRFDAVIPTVSDDELALLASYHNAMIERLRDRDRLYRTLEKSVGANIMNKLLNTDEQILKQGQTYNVAILFCDLRGFTSLGESASAEEIILFLNVYFADISSVISEHNGIINKFMGDAVLAIFGLESDGNPVEDAVNASLAIIKHSTDFYMPNAMHPESGVGIDFGSVIGGTIGSEERYEYTIIGDAVNKASRLESLSKRLGYSIILSQNAYKWLSNDMRKSFDSLGAHKVRGGNEPITIYGSGKNPKKVTVTNNENNEYKERKE